MQKKYSVLRSAIWGALIGAAWGLGSNIIKPTEQATSGGDYFIGMLIGGALGGAVLFALVAFIINLFAKAP